MQGDRPGDRRIRDPLLVLLVSFAMCCGRPALAPDRRQEVPLDRALKAIHLRRADLGVDVDALPGPPAVPIVRRSLQDPLCAPQFADSLVDCLKRDSSSSSALRMLSGLSGLSPPVPASRRAAGRLADALKDLDASCGLRPGTGETPDRSSAIEGLSDPVKQALAVLLEGVARARVKVEAAVSGLTPGQRQAVSRIRLLVTDSLAESEARQVVAAAGKVDVGRLFVAAMEVTAAAERAREILASTSGTGRAITDVAPAPRWETGGLEGDVIAAFQSPAGPVIVGGPGRTVYRCPAAIILDVGGEDLYEDGAGGATGPGLPVSVCLDMGGDDTYLATGPGAQGAGERGVGSLLDAAGNDRYVSRSGVCQGCGVLGAGVLVDRAGDDVYDAGYACQGAGAFGLGLLLDREGRDSYRAGVVAQGYGGPGGVGALIDRDGDDIYFAGGRVGDFREEGHFQSLAQGFGTGIRPFAAGGFGLLADLAGDDGYEGDYFAQGSGYWAGAGLLLDTAGDDRYTARRYAQGSASHAAVGLLADRAGNDAYRSWGVSQGCGHDLSVGWLSDRSGDDRYEAVLLSQGVGNANGVGILADGSGDDRYTGERNVQGSGVAERGYESVGVLLDGGGRDVYTGKGRDGEIWTDGESGVGLDGEAEALW